MNTQTAPRPAAVAAVLAQSSKWTAARRKSDGQPFFFIPGSAAGAVYMTSTIGCTCPAAQHSRTGDCKHQQAVKIAQRETATVPAPKPSKGYSDIFPVCSVNGCDEAAGRSGRCHDHNRRLLAND